MGASVSDYLNTNEIQSELVIGLVCAVGTETERAIELLKERLGRAGYAVHVVKISRDVIQPLLGINPEGADKYQRISSLMDAGNKVREAANNDAVLAFGAATCIRAFEAQTPNNSLKHCPSQQ